MIAEDAAFRPVAGWTPPLNTMARCAPLRGFRLLVALAACTAACAPTVALGGSQHDGGYVSLSGNEARQFLVGNSMEDFPAMADGSPVGPDVRYLASETTVFEGSLNGGTCMVEPWGFRRRFLLHGIGDGQAGMFSVSRACSQTRARGPSESRRRDRLCCRRQCQRRRP